MSGATFLSGVAMATFAMSGVFFLKFWKVSRDRFYLYFTLTCWLLALERIVLLIVSTSDLIASSNQTEAISLVYTIRLAAFSVIIGAIWQKNRKAAE